MVPGQAPAGAAGLAGVKGVSVNRPFVLGLLFCLALPVSARPVKIETYIFDIQVEKSHLPITMTVEYREDGIHIVYCNEFGEKEISFFSEPTRLARVVYIDAEGRQTARVEYDYLKHTVTLTGLINVCYRSAENTYDNNGSLLYLFSRLYPPPGGKINFYLIQSNLSHIDDSFLRFLISQLVGPVRMYLKDQGQESVEVLGQNYATTRYELGIADGSLARFWPHTYHFWYSLDERLPVQYQGIDAQRRVNTITLVDFYVREYPNPELPTL